MSEKKKGKLYTNPSKDLVIMCTRNSKEGNLTFEGVVLDNGDLTVAIGTINDAWVQSHYTERIGPISLNNVTINE